AVPEGAKWQYNWGMRLKLFPGIDVGLSYQRGDTFSFMFHVQDILGRQALPQKPDPPLRAPVDRRPFHERDLKEMVEKIHDAIHEEGFTEVSVYTNGKDVTAEFFNRNYLFHQKAVGRILRILLFYSPSDTRKITAVAQNRNTPVLKVSVAPQHFDKYLLGEISEETFQKLCEVETTDKAVDPDETDWVQSDKDKIFQWDWGVKPDFMTSMLDRTNYVQWRFALMPWLTVNPWKGGLATARYDIPLYSNIFTSAVTPPDAVRSDFAKYYGTDAAVDKLMVDQAFRLSEKTFSRISLGYLEKMYAGVGGEVLHFIGDGDLAVGVMADWARKREPGSTLALTDFDVYDLLANAYYRLPFKGLDTTLHVQFGRYLAGDVGFVFDISRKYDTGTIVGARYSLTDTDHLTGRNKNYNDKAIYISIPLRSFMTHDSRSRFSYAIREWGRDVAASIYHWQPLYHRNSRPPILN
ncbi:MAG: YjbH domain-containing protein, partial [Deltaproteobacteria bacterium]|nr:YjbH domain-containing protein [Deltaproteobacteria bacterium]